jgi:hypothetical protein
MAGACPISQPGLSKLGVVLGRAAGAIPRTHRTADSDGREARAAANLLQRETLASWLDARHWEITSVEQVEKWVLGTSPRMTFVGV